MATRLAPPAARLLHKMAAQGDEGGGRSPGFWWRRAEPVGLTGPFYVRLFVLQPRSIHVHDQKATLPLLAQHLVLHVTVLIN